MSFLRQHRLTLALLVSILLHLAAVGAPGWRMPVLSDLLPEDKGAGAALRIDAHLAGPPAGRKPIAPKLHTVATKPARAPIRTSQAPPAVPGVLSIPPDESAVETSELVDDAVEVAGGAATSDSANILDEAVEENSEGASQAPTTLLAAATSGAAKEAGHASPMQVPAAVLLPRRGSVRFVVSRGDQGFVVGQSTHHWNHDGKTYVVDSVTETTGLIALFRSVRVTWLSQGEMRSDGLLPHEFRTEKDGVRGDAATFDWSTMKLGLTGGPQREVHLQPGTQDVLSMFYQLTIMLPTLTQEATQVGGAREKQGSFTLYVTTGRKLERYRFEVLGEERVVLPHRGSQRTLHLRTPAGDQIIDIWLARDLRGLPVRIRYTDGKGDSFDQKAEEIEFEGMTRSLSQ